MKKGRDGVRRQAILATSVALLVALWGIQGHPTRTDAHSRVSARTTPQRSKGAIIPIHASLSLSSLRAGDQQMLKLSTARNASIMLRVVYPQTGGFKKRGKTGQSGTWEHGWIVRAGYPGQATVSLLVSQGKASRHYTLHFTVLAPATATVAPSSPPTATPIATSGSAPVPTATDSPTPTPTIGGDISLQSVDFYTDVNSNGPVGTPQTTFSSSIATIYAYATFSSWQGNHEVTFNWYAPNGSLYQHYTDASIDAGPADSYDGLDVAGQDAAKLQGQWTLTMVVDGHVATSKSFTLTK